MMTELYFPPPPPFLSSPYCTMNSGKELYVFFFWSKSFINLSCVRYLYLLKLIWTVSLWAKSCDCPYHVGMWALPVPLSPANILAVFSNNRKLKSVSLSFCLSDSDYSLLTGVGSLSGRQANVSIISMDLLWDFDTQPPSSTPKPCSISLSLSVLSTLSLSFSYRTLSPTANLAGILPLSPTWSTRLCPVEVCHCPVIKTQTFHLPVSVQWTAAFLTNALNASTSVMERIVISLDNVHTFWGTAWTEMSVGWEIIEFTSLPLGAAGQTFSIKHFLHTFEEFCLLFGLPVLMNVRLQFINDKLT